MSKKVDFGFEGSKLVVTIDLNEDGQALMKLELELSEIPDEVMGLIAAKKLES